MDFSFRLWLEMGVWQHRPLQLQWGNEFQAPTDVTGQQDFSGPGLICFDFDKTLTAGARNPLTGHVHSTDQPNGDMLKVAQKHKSLGNHTLIVTARGLTSNREAGMTKTPSIDVYQAIPKWGVGGLFDDVILTGGDSVVTPSENKAPVFARLMVKYNTKWGLLYDDDPRNCHQADAMQARGFAMRGIPVKPKLVG